MIFVTLGTQDKSFDRLLKAIDKEIKNGNIKEKVIVQAGYTNYKSKNMEIFDLVSREDFDKYIKEANVVITHGGVGSILTALNNGKKVIAAPRLSKYNEHTNDHQLQIVNKFSEEGYILGLNDFNELGILIKEAKKFTPKKYKSNNKKFCKLVDNTIEGMNNVSWFNKSRGLFLWLLFGLINVLTFVCIKQFNIELYSNIIYSWAICVFLAYICKNNKTIKFIINTIEYLISDIIIMFLLINFTSMKDFICKIISVIIILIFDLLIKFIKNK